MARLFPDWPRMMKRATAAAYCDMSPAEFEREVSAGRIPLPVRLGESEKWSRVHIDEHLERLTGDRIPDWRATARAYAQK